jgi:hypothetical protein
MQGAGIKVDAYPSQGPFMIFTSLTAVPMLCVYTLSDSGASLSDLPCDIRISHTMGMIAGPVSASDWGVAISCSVRCGVGVWGKRMEAVMVDPRSCMHSFDSKPDSC